MAGKRRHLRRKHPAVELNITAFMNLMVVLVPFLLMTAVFNHITILDLNLPELGKPNPSDKPPTFELRVTIREQAMFMTISQVAKPVPIKMLRNEHNYFLLKQILLQVKAEHPDQTSIIILAEKNTPYDHLIQVMDAARSFRTSHEGKMVDAELFPNISIGDASVRKTAKARK